MRKSQIIGCSWILVILAMSAVVGLIGRQFLGEIDNENLVFVHMVRRLFPAFISGVLLSAILAAAMSTADSQLLAASSSVSNDILVKFFHFKTSARAQLLISRLSLIGIAILGIFLAWDSNSSVFQIVSFAWAGFGAAFGPVMLLALFWKRSNRYGAVAGMLCGGIMIFIWKFLVRPMGGVWNIYELLPAFLAALAVNVIVSLATPAPEKEIVRTFEEV